MQEVHAPDHQSLPRHRFFFREVFQVEADDGGEQQEQHDLGAPAEIAGKHVLSAFGEQVEHARPGGKSNPSQLHVGITNYFLE